MRINAIKQTQELFLGTPGLNGRQAINQIEETWGEAYGSFDIYFYEDENATVATALANDAIGVLKVFELYNDADPLAQAVTWTKKTSGNDTFYRFALSFNGTDLNAKFTGSNADYQDFRLQLKWSSATTPADQIFPAETLRLHNNGIRDGGVAPIEPESETAASETYVNNAVDTAIDALDTAVTPGTFSVGSFSMTINQKGQVTAATNGRAGERVTALSLVDATAAPPTEVADDVYLLDEGTPHAGWDGAASNDLVTFNGTTWDAVTYDEGDVVHLDDVDADAVLEDGVWNSKADIVRETATQTLTGKTLDLASNTLENFPVELIIPVSDETTDLTTGTGKITIRAPYAFTLASVRASVNTAPTGSTIIVDINLDGSTIMAATKLSIDATEKTSTTATAAVLSTTAVADDAEIAIDIDQIGSTIAGAGLKVTLLGSRTV